MKSMLSLRVEEPDKQLLKDVLALLQVKYILNQPKRNDPLRLVEFYIPVIQYPEAIRAMTYSAQVLYNRSVNKILRTNLKQHEDQ
jgi:hypothetical protein